LVCAVPAVEFEGFCDAVAERVEESAAPIDELVESAVESLLVSTVDPYTRYVPPELSGILREDGIIGGVGMVVAALNAAGSPCIRIGESCPLIVTAVIPESPASVGGLVAGDVIRTIDGENLNGLSLVKVAALIGGEPNTTVVLAYRRNGVEGTTTLTRADASYTPVSGEVVGQTGYIRLPEFGAETHVVFHLWLQSILDAGVNRLILDLRDNPGGYLFSVSIMGSEFLSSGLLYKTQSPTEDRDYPAIDGGIATRIPLIVLVNEQSASAAEMLAAGLQERGRATVVGAPTYGKNLVQTPFELHNQGQLFVTIATWTTPGGASVAETGVVPDLGLQLDAGLPVADVVALTLAALG
jgi:carboxyl-terminal processing protease